MAFSSRVILSFWSSKKKKKKRERKPRWLSLTLHFRMKGCNHPRSCLRNDRFSIPIWIALVSHFWIQKSHISSNLLCHIPIPAENNTLIPRLPSRNIHMVSILLVQCYRLSDCHFTWDNPEISFSPSKQRPDQFNLANINLKNICCFIGKTHVYETAWSLTFFIIHSSLPVGEAEILHASEVDWICYSTQGNYCSSRKRAYLYWLGWGGSKHWGHLFANCEPLGQNELEDLKFCVDCLVNFQICTISFYTDLLLLMHSFL